MYIPSFNRYGKKWFDAFRCIIVYHMLYFGFGFFNIT
jgi:hypothetical protein